MWFTDYLFIALLELQAMVKEMCNEEMSTEEDAVKLAKYSLH